MNERDLELRQASGTVSTTDPFAAFLYVLIKDYLPANKLEEALIKVRGVMPGLLVFNNGWFGRYALDLKNKLDALREDAVGKVEADTSTLTFTHTAQPGEETILEQAEAVLNRLQNTMPKEEFEQVKQDVKDYTQDHELDQAFKDLIIEEPK